MNSDPALFVFCIIIKNGSVSSFCSQHSSQLDQTRPWSLWSIFIVVYWIQVRFCPLTKIFWNSFSPDPGLSLGLFRTVQCGPILSSNIAIRFDPVHIISCLFYWSNPVLILVKFYWSGLVYEKTNHAENWCINCNSSIVITFEIIFKFDYFRVRNPTVWYSYYSVYYYDSFNVKIGTVELRSHLYIFRY